jgi:hypothetical protein
MHIRTSAYSVEKNIGRITQKVDALAAGAALEVWGRRRVLRHGRGDGNGGQGKKCCCDIRQHGSVVERVMIGSRLCRTL